mmetsp:Transcript_10581/g.28165  ORF Transcript_10581/g.28165 Transcript_10581/m.28165 type:complete len:90 (+) Transcript_10581:287-556(+)
MRRMLMHDAARESKLRQLSIGCASLGHKSLPLLLRACSSTSRIARDSTRSHVPTQRCDCTHTACAPEEHTHRQGSAPGRGRPNPLRCPP